MTNNDLEAKYFKNQLKQVSDYEICAHKKDWENKYSSSKGLLSDFIKRVGKLEGKKILDSGFGNGIMASVFNEAGATVFGVEVNADLLPIALDNIGHDKSGITFQIYDGKHLPFEDNFFDYAYSTSVIEHVTDKVKYLSQIYRVLKPGGKLYLAFPNRISLKETHTGIYGLNYLNRNFARCVLKMMGRSTIDDWNLYFLSYFWLIRTLRKNGFSFKIQFETASPNLFKLIFKNILKFFGIHHSALLSHVILILQK